MSTVHVVVGGQFGSEGKGHFTSQLCQKLEAEVDTPMVIRTGGPNAGHTVIGPDGKEWKLRQIPVAAVTCPNSPIAIAAGGEIDDEVLNAEILALEQAGIPIMERLLIDAQATLMQPFHKVQEMALVEEIGSTGKGIGAARADRIMRSAGVWGGTTSVAEEAGFWLASREGPVVLEATQGYGLGLHAGFYPKCTSRDVRAIDVLAEAGISPWQPGVDRVLVWVVFRPFPIRVAGDSGPLQWETSWEDLGLDIEYTTVTGKIRRVGMWDGKLARDAMHGNGAPSPFVTPIMMFADYIDETVVGATELDVFDRRTWDAMAPYEKDIGTEIAGFGTSASTFVWRFGWLGDLEGE
jgi:adenylosuccinate synthase